MGRCRSCNGRGQVHCLGQRSCGHCSGSGREYQPGVGMDIFMPCNWCRGSGQSTETYYETCSSCGGSGVSY